MRRNLVDTERRLSRLLVMLFPELPRDCVRADHRRGGFWIHYDDGISWCPYDLAAYVLDAGECTNQRDGKPV
jgi:hypothetical protein